MLEIAHALCSECGTRSRNEDVVRVFRDGARWAAVLADGAGGHRDGAEAARRAVDAVERALMNAGGRFDPQQLDDAVQAAHASVKADQQDAQGSERMLSTIVVLWIDAESGRALWSHVGDSRLYRCRHGRTEMLTPDDSVVQRMLDAGLLTAEQAMRHPHRNQLIAALGIEDDIEPHTTDSFQVLEEGDAYLLCSDGWWGSLSEHDIGRQFAVAETPEAWLMNMRRHVASSARDDQDNHSAVAMWMGDVHDVTRPGSLGP